MFKRILIANRGEIAVRVFRACRELDIEPVVVYSEADREALHVQLAEHAYCIGPAPSAKSYLDVNAILTVAKAAHCDAIHPGYGFLSENADFAQRCADEGIAFIGPSAQVISTMGNKAAARELMKSAGVPVVPGSDGSVADVAEAHRIADEIDIGRRDYIRLRGNAHDPAAQSIGRAGQKVEQSARRVRLGRLKIHEHRLMCAETVGNFGGLIELLGMHELELHLLLFLRRSTVARLLLRLAPRKHGARLLILKAFVCRDIVLLPGKLILGGALFVFYIIIVVRVHSVANVI